jgi:filamentous hemagglutinin family protein
MGSSILTRRLLATSALAGLAAISAIPVSLANPTGGQVAAGQAAITAAGPNLTVTQSTGRVVIDWSTFNIAPNENVLFRQPSGSSIALNRIHDANPSQIDGSLTANGQVWLINANGIMFGNGGGNYSITYNSANLTLAAKTLTDTGFTAANKTYDGTTAATITADGSLTGGSNGSNDGKYLSRES